MLGADPGEPTDLAIALGGDGTILSALRHYAGRVGARCSRSTTARSASSPRSSPTSSRRASRRALAGGFDVMKLPVLVAETAQGEQLGVNDMSFHRRQSGRVAELAYTVDGHELGEVRCDGLVVATPAGSTGYNLANGGPVLAWGVEGFVVSFIAPHTLTARALVVAPDDVLEVTNRSPTEEVDLTTDGRTACAVAPGRASSIRLRRDSRAARPAPGRDLLHTPARQVRPPLVLSDRAGPAPSAPLVDLLHAPRAAHREPAADRARRAAARARASR